jgi:hypothetical protein
MIACNKADLGAKVFDSAFIIKELDKAMCALALRSTRVCRATGNFPVDTFA